LEYTSTLPSSRNFPSTQEAATSSNNPTFKLEPGDEALTSAIVSDSLDELGYRTQVFGPGILPLVKGSRLFGRASTVQFVPTNVDSDRPYDDAISYIDALNTGDVAVLATGGNLSSAYWGELFSAAAIGRGAVGVVTDGNIRDVAKIEALGFAAFSAGRRPVDFRARMKIESSHCQIVLGGVAVNQGDLVLADDDGIVVIPPEVEAKVWHRARSRATKESIVLAELLSGESPRAVWDTYSVL
jgi:regulator of RNase E activity RraA